MQPPRFKFKSVFLPPRMIFKSPFAPTLQTVPVQATPVLREGGTPNPMAKHLGTLRAILDDLRDAARVNHMLEKDTENPDARAVFAAARRAKESQANAMLEVLKSFGADNLPDPLNLDFPENSP